VQSICSFDWEFGHVELSRVNRVVTSVVVVLLEQDSYTGPQRLLATPKPDLMIISLEHFFQQHCHSHNHVSHPRSTKFRLSHHFVHAIKL